MSADGSTSPLPTPGNCVPRYDQRTSVRRPGKAIAWSASIVSASTVAVSAGGRRSSSAATAANPLSSVTNRWWRPPVVERVHAVAPEPVPRSPDRQAVPGRAVGEPPADALGVAVDDGPQRDLGPLGVPAAHRCSTRRTGGQPRRPPSSRPSCSRPGAARRRGGRPARRRTGHHRPTGSGELGPADDDLAQVRRELGHGAHLRDERGQRAAPGDLALQAGQRHRPRRRPGGPRRSVRTRPSGSPRASPPAPGSRPGRPTAAPRHPRRHAPRSRRRACRPRSPRRRSPRRPRRRSARGAAPCRRGWR